MLGVMLMDCVSNRISGSIGFDFIGLMGKGLPCMIVSCLCRSIFHLVVLVLGLLFGCFW
jgi:hypothetical protein